MNADVVIDDVRSRLAGEPVFLAGSLVAADVYDKQDAWSDVDIFCPTAYVLIATGQRLLDQGFTLDDRYERTWVRWLSYGMKNWHTNSLKLQSPDGVEWNLIYKLSEGHPTTSLSQVFESFDFGHLGVGWDLKLDRFMDIRPYLFPVQAAGLSGADLNEVEFPLMPNKRDNWRNGFISKYNGLREPGRYGKNHQRGYLMGAVKDDMVTGYWAASLYFSQSFDEEKQMLGRIYEVIARHIEADHIDELVKASTLIEYKDSLDVIMEALE